MIDRTHPPQALPVARIPMPRGRTIKLSCGLPVYMVQYGTQEILEMRYVVPAGLSFQPAPGLAQFAAALITEGTSKYSSLELARKLDSIGAILDADNGYESSTISLTVLSSRIAEALPILVDTILDATYPEDELEKLRTRMLEYLEVENQKTEYLARKKFNSTLFGKEHPYGAQLEKEEILSVNLQALRNFHHRNFAPVNAFMVAVGKFDEEKLIQSLDALLPAADTSLKLDPASSLGLLKPEGGQGFHYVEKQETMQATLRVGHLAFERANPQFTGMQVVTTLFGGYFGSRLNRNIREDKGYTYHIGGSWTCMKHAGLFLIQTDVGNAYIKPTLEQIRFELNRMINERVGEEELNLVKNYMLGRLISSRETPEQVADLIVTAMVNETPLEELDQRFDNINNITPEIVQELANQNFHPDHLLEVVCGKME